MYSTFTDRLKSISRGASFDYIMLDHESDLVKMDIKLNNEKCRCPFCSWFTEPKQKDLVAKMVKTQELLPRQQFVIAIQAAVGAKIIARETISALRKDVTAKCYVVTSPVNVSCWRNRKRVKRNAPGWFCRNPTKSVFGSIETGLGSVARWLVGSFLVGSMLVVEGAAPTWNNEMIEV
ncbi:MAG: hypothetical protein R2769_12900 [Saprospiraceae bacterium]